MLKIDQLSLALPHGFEHRAEDIARLTADGLAELPAETWAVATPAGTVSTGTVPSQLRQLERVAPAPIEVTAGATNTEVARQVTAAVQQQITSSSARLPGGSQ